MLLFLVFVIHQPRRSTSLAPPALGSLRSRHPDEKPLSINSLFATLTSTPQTAENTSTLSPFLATHTDLSPCKPFVCHSYENCRVSLPPLAKNLKSYLKFVFPGSALGSPFSLLTQRVFRNPFAIRRFHTLSKNSRVASAFSAPLSTFNSQPPRISLLLYILAPLLLSFSNEREF